MAAEAAPGGLAPALPSALHRGLQELGQRDCSTGQDGAQPGQLSPSLVHLQFTVNQQNGASFPLLPTLSGKDGTSGKSPRDTQRGGSKHSLET